MCCLRYEHEVYEEAIKQTPPHGSVVSTKEGNGVVVDTKPLLGEIKVKFNEKDKETVKPFKIADVKVVSRPEKHHGKHDDGENDDEE
jgi:cell fate regulator YaaT (PSP1 superfamily)